MSRFESFPLSRRSLLARCSTGFGLAALAAMRSGAAGSSAPAIVTPPLPPMRPRARNVIFCFMSGGVSHLDSFDPKPRLDKEAGKPMPMPVERTQFNNNGTIMPSPWRFRAYGQSGIEVSDLFPHLGSCADDLCVVRSMTAPFSEHAQGNFFLHTGFPFLGYPSAGAWASYGLGSESRDLPSYVVLRSGGSGIPHGGVGLYSNGFLPGAHQASLIGADAGEPLRNIQARESHPAQRRRLDFVASLDHAFAGRAGGDTQIEAAIANYETAFRMQAAVPGLCDLADEPEEVRRLYGLDDADPRKSGYARQCLLARRLVERGVRFVELTCLSYDIGGGNAANPWDQHGQLKEGHGRMGHQVDQPIAALLKDLKRRGLLDETIVLWAGEFGRTPFSQGSDGRDHDPFGFSIWLAGGGFRGGTICGATDDYGYRAVSSPVTVYDLWATALHQLGIDHEELTYLFGGRNLRLTDVHGNVLKDLLA
ncbi:MAG TPA: DUF1501 domain-containing protein [Verrucomicrobiales bacterium]|nr:DUF1501 domain-containing protein [Verrucomicrobiales bacterium]